MFLLGLNGVLVHFNHPKFCLHSPCGLQPAEWFFIINTTDLISASYSSVDMCCRISVQDSFLSFLLGFTKRQGRACSSLGMSVRVHGTVVLLYQVLVPENLWSSVPSKQRKLHLLSDEFMTILSRNLSSKQFREEIPKVGFFFCSLAGLRLLRKPQQANNPCQQWYIEQQHTLSFLVCCSDLFFLVLNIF